jgi:hypothetical protein
MMQSIFQGLLRTILKRKTERTTISLSFPCGA